MNGPRPWQQLKAEGAAIEQGFLRLLVAGEPAAGLSGYVSQAIIANADRLESAQ